MSTRMRQRGVHILLTTGWEVTACCTYKEAVGRIEQARQQGRVTVEFNHPARVPSRGGHPDKFDTRKPDLVYSLALDSIVKVTPRMVSDSYLSFEGSL